MSHSTLAEIRPADAPAEIAALYERIRRAAAFPQVNLVYRHLATLPGVLAWAWHVLEPHYASGRINRDCERLLATLPPGDGEPVWNALPEPARGELRAVLVSYNTANAQNLIALTALRDAVRQGVRGVRRRDSPDAPTRMPDRPVGSIPPLPTLRQLADDHRDLVEGLAALHSGRAAGVIPSMYLHLALWPEALRAAHTRLAGFVESGAWRQQKTALMQRAAAASSRLAAELDADQPPPSPLLQNRALDALNLFVNGTIPDMLLVGRALYGASPLSA